MAKKKQIEETVERLLEPIAQRQGVVIYDVEYVREGKEYFLRAYIDKEDGVTIDDCVDVSHALSDALDRADPIADPYTLEVSSPGLGRRLTKDRHLLRSLGEAVEGTLFAVREDIGSKNFEGILADFDKDTITLEVSSGEEEGTMLVLPRKEIAKLSVKIDF